MQTTYDEVKQFLGTHLNIGCPASADFGDKIALFGLLAYLTNALKQKKPDITHYKVLRMCTKDQVVDDNLIQIIAAVTEWLSWNCVKFPDLGVPLKEIPEKIKNLIYNTMPF